MSQQEKSKIMLIGFVLCVWMIYFIACFTIDLLFVSMIHALWLSLSIATILSLGFVGVQQFFSSLKHTE
ncbi:hypothetical protein [Leuconostoc lactis]|uniref:hypothetical protein n=1 Tax=Leuconostoc lactis TaxID=1246 RepID=UPI0024ADF384|nr:hypothetical protein [Leuconostoc lactis]MDI6496455.1 hypothetical protein [Leuconostoc lactis]